MPFDELYAMTAVVSGKQRSPANSVGTSPARTIFKSRLLRNEGNFNPKLLYIETALDTIFSTLPFSALRLMLFSIYGD